MKKVIKLLMASAFFMSCSNEYLLFEQKAMRDGRNPKLNSFIQLKDGTIIPCNNLDLKQKNVLANVYFTCDGKQTNIKQGDAIMFQDDRSCTCYLNPFGWITRLRSGKIELYVYFMSHRAGEKPSSLVARKGVTGNLVILNKTVLRNLISDNKTVLANFDDTYSKRYLVKSTLEIIDDYNRR